MVNLLYVALGSAVGGMCRYGMTRLTAKIFGGIFPWPTFLTNMLGCLLIGLLYGLIARGVGISDHVRLLLIVGFCGGFTTFSTFAHENYLLFASGTRGLLTVAAYASLSFFAGLIMVWIGHRITGA